MKFSVDKILNYWFNLQLTIRDEYFDEQHEHLRKKYLIFYLEFEFITVSLISNIIALYF